MVTAAQEAEQVIHLLEGHWFNPGYLESACLHECQSNSVTEAYRSKCFECSVRLEVANPGHFGMFHE